MSAPLPRPARLANPGDLRRVAGQIWLGEASEQPDPEFVAFRAPEFGFRALAITLTTYFTAHGLRTVRAIVDRFAPPSENDTGAYIDDVAARCGVGPDDPIDVHAYRVMLGLCLGIAHHEGGGPWFTAQQAVQGLALAGITAPPA